MLPSDAKFFQRELSRMVVCITYACYRVCVCATMIRNICGFFHSVRNGRLIDRNVCSRLRLPPKFAKNFISIWTEQSHMRSIRSTICCRVVVVYLLQLQNLLRIWFLHSIWFAAKGKHLIVVRHMCSEPSEPAFHGWFLYYPSMCSLTSWSMAQDRFRSPSFVHLIRIRIVNHFVCVEHIGSRKFRKRWQH